MCSRQKGDPKLLPRLPLGDPLTNGVGSPRHMTSNSEGEPSEPALEITQEELEGAVVSLVDPEILLSTIGSRHMCLDLVKQYEIELERIDQQLLELGPYAQDAYDDEEMPPVVSAPVVVSPPLPPPDVRRGRKGKQAAAQKGGRRVSRVEDSLEVQRGGWRGGSWTEVSDRRQDEKEAPKKKWRKVGSAGPAVRGREGQLDAQSDPLNVSSANLILTPPGGRRESCDLIATHPLTSPVMQIGGGVVGAAMPMGVSVSTTAHSTPSCNTSSPSELPGHARPQPTAHWRPLGTPASRDHAREGPTNHTTQGDTLEEIDVTRIDEVMPNGSHLVADGRSVNSELHLLHHLQARRGPHSSKLGHPADVVMADLHRAHFPPSSPQTTPHHGQNETLPPHLGTQQYHHHPQANATPKHTGFSISNLAKGSDTPPQSHDNHMASYIEHRGPGSTSSIPSPHGDLDCGVRKRRSSSSSSHRSARHSMDDNTFGRSGSPLSSHARGQVGVIWDGSANSPGNKERLAMDPVKPTGLPPFAMWPPGVPVPTDPAQLQRLSLSSPFLAASNPWLRGGMIPGLPFRPVLYPTGAAAAATNSLDPTNTYKSMLGLPIYQFPSGLKASFPTPAFTAPNSVSNSQPQTPSAISCANPGFSFGQYPVPQALGANAALQEAQSRFQGQLMAQPTSFAVSLDNQQRWSPDSNQETSQPWPMIPGMPMLQAQLGFGLQNALPSSISQASLLAAAQRGSTPFSTSPLTLVTQSAGLVGEQQQPPGDVYHSNRRGKKQSAIDLTGRHIEAPSPQEAVKMATQRMSPFHDPSRYSPKLKSVGEGATAPPSSSHLVPTFVTNPNALPSQPQGSVISYPLLNPSGGAGLVNHAQLMGVAMPGNPMLPMNYPPMQNVVGKPEEGTGKKRSPKRGGGAQKLRIHQMEFKQQGKVDRRRRRPLKPQEKVEESVAMVKSTPPGAQLKVTPPASTDQPSQEDNYALNMLADCSSKEGENSASPLTVTTPTKQVELANKRALMRSPGSIAGANSLLLLAKPEPTSSRPRDSSQEIAVVDGLLQLSNAAMPRSVSSQEQSHSGVQNQSMKLSEPGSQTVPAGSEVRGGERKARIIPGPLQMPRRRLSEEGKEKDEVDSEKTDTDSEATLSPTTPAPTSSCAPSGVPRAAENNTSPSSHPPSLTPAQSSTPVSSSGQIGNTSVTLPPTTQSDDTTREALALPVNQALSESASGAAVPSELRTNEGNVPLGLPPSSLISTRLQPVDDEEEDADVDVENIDTSLIEEPAQPVLNSLFPAAQPLLPKVSSPPAQVTTGLLEPEIVPTSPLPPSSLQDGGSSLPLPQQTESRSEVGMTGGVVSVDEPLSTLQLPIDSDVTEVTSIDCPSPPKKLKLEEEADKRVKEVEDQPVEPMDAVSSPPQPSVPMKRWSSSPAHASPTPPPSSNGDNPSEQVPPISPPPLPDSGVIHQPAGSPDDVKPTEEVLNLSSDGAVSYQATEESSATEEPFSSPEYCEKIGNDLKNTVMDSIDEESNTAIECGSPDRSTVEANGFHSDTSTAMAGSEPEAQEMSQQEQDTGRGQSPTPCISWPSETEEEDGEGELRVASSGTPRSSPTHSQSNAAASEPAGASSPQPKAGSTSPRHGDATKTSGTPARRAISPIRPPENSDQPALAHPIEENKSQVKDTGSAKPRPGGDTTPPETGWRVSPPVAQNRLPVGKSGFDRHQQSRKLTSHKQHSREEKNGGGSSKKWSRMIDPGSRGRGLFDVDPQEGARRSKVDGRPGDRDPMKHTSSSEARNPKSRPLPPGHVHPSKPVGADRKYSNSTRPREDQPARHSRSSEPHPVGGAWEQREAGPGKPKPRPAADWDEMGDEEQMRGAGRGKGYQNSHGGWREDRGSPTDHARDRERGHTPGKHKSHRTESSKFEHGRKLARGEKDTHKHVSAVDSSDERGAAAVFKRHRGGDDDSDHAPSSRLKHGPSERKRSYESVSEDEVLENSRRSSRESSLVAEDRTRSDRHTSQEAGVDQRWRKEGKRAGGEGGDGVDEFVRLKHKKHKHDGKERRKWRKLAESGGELKMKRSSEDKPRLGYHKH